MQRKNEFHVGNPDKSGVVTTKKAERGCITAPLERFIESQRAGDVNAEKQVFSTTTQDLSLAGNGSNFRLHGIYFPIYKFHSICSRAKIYIKELLLCNRIIDLASNNREWGVKTVIQTNYKEVYSFSNTRSSIVSFTITSS